jgi:hypothetical protein
VAGHELEPAAGGIEPAPGGKSPETDDIVRVALAFKTAVDELVRLARSSRSLGLASWGAGIVFAGVAVGLRFVTAADMEAPEFISCFVFAALLVVFGIVVYIMESRGYVKLVSEIAVKRPGEPAHRELGGGGDSPG